MPRRGFIPKREVLPDPIYGSTIVTKLINQVMYNGKRGNRSAFLRWFFYAFYPAHLLLFYLLSLVL